MKKFIKSIIPDPVKIALRKILAPAGEFGWFGNYKTWEEAQKNTTGYDAANILEKVKTSVLKVKSGEAIYERDSVLFDEIQYDKPLLDALKKIAAENNDSLHVVDFGGSLGSSYFQHRGLLKDLKELKWSVVEQKHFVDCGKKSIEEAGLKFYYSIEEALKHTHPQVLLLSCVIQYFENPYELIQECMEYGFEYIIIERTAFIRSEEERITVQIVPEFIYKASYPAWFLNEEKLIKYISPKYKLVNSFLSELSKPMLIEKKTEVYWKGFIFKKNK